MSKQHVQFGKLVWNLYLFIYVEREVNIVSGHYNQAKVCMETSIYVGEHLHKENGASMPKKQKISMNKTKSTTFHLHIPEVCLVGIQTVSQQAVLEFKKDTNKDKHGCLPILWM